MFAVFVTFEIKPGHRDAFMVRMLKQAEDSLEKEKDCGVFEVWVNSNNPNKVQLYEVYLNAAAFDVHLESPHFKNFAAAVEDMIISKDIQTFDQKL